jgi:hypothetical protein
MAIMTHVPRNSWRLFAGLALLAVGCDAPAPMTSESQASGPSLAAARAPVEVPLQQSYDDINPCTGLQMTLYYTGTARVQDFGDHSLFHVNGTVTTSDGWTGKFTWTFTFLNDQVAHVTAHDMELNSATGQREIFPVGLEVHIAVDGRPVVDLVHFSKDRTRCVGPA